ncbi:MAG: phosphate regulon sensor histidine kinase PhoR [Rubrivivax sp.]|nr:phosphate regulon sensor histidine kinase PhoR [Rubrivivax sp.]
MAELLPRAVTALLVLGLGAALGALTSLFTGRPLAMSALGALLALLLVNVRQAARGHRLLEWLRSPRQTPAPRDAGFWGELGYRFERALRNKDVELQAERQRLQEFLAAIDASPNGVMLLDASDQISWLNSVAAEHLGLDPTRDRLQRVTNLVRAPAFVSYMQDGRFEEPIVFAGPLGRSTLSVIVRAYGEGMKLMLTQDITERERAEAMRRDFVANVSHEIRTPLTVVAGFVETLAQLPLTEVERRRVLTLMEQQTDRMQSLVGDLLTLAQLEGSPRPGPDRWVAAAPILQRAHDDALALSAGRHRIDISGGADAEIAGSEAELISAVGNLLNNAVRYTPVDGQISLRWAWRDGGAADIEVSDTGIGIAREHLPRLTERFYRVDGSRSRDTGGTGLGLSIVKHVVQRHGGEIDVQSEIGKGTTFRMQLPAQRVRRLAAADEVPAAAVAAAPDGTVSA